MTRIASDFKKVSANALRQVVMMSFLLTYRISSGQVALNITVCLPLLPFPDGADEGHLEMMRRMAEKVRYSFK